MTAVYKPNAQLKVLKLLDIDPLATRTHLYAKSTMPFRIRRCYDQR